MINLPRLQLALIGQGGPNGNEYLNPFGSADARSPNYVAGVTDNSQELVDWLAPSIDWRDSQTELTVFEMNATGDVFQMPAGMARMAVGYQMRDVEEWNYANPLSKSGEDYNTSVIDSPPIDQNYGSRVQAAYCLLYTSDAADE